tara:strand:- start:1482 stop:2009 length:528 start_codon:yes stop_codon:yes gene_type:complete
MSSKPDDNGSILWPIIIISVIAFLGWMAIPSSELNGFLATVYAFGDGLLVGWGDELTVKIMHAENPRAASDAMSAFRDAAVDGVEDYMWPTSIALLVGTFLSPLGVVAVWMARSAKTHGSAFFMGAGAEVFEGVLYHSGYYSTVGEWAVSSIEIIATGVVATIMGFIAMSRVKAG